jgi:hypothetical protein
MRAGMSTCAFGSRLATADGERRTEVPEVVRGGDAGGHRRDLTIGAAEAGEDRLDDRSVVEVEVGAQQGCRGTASGDER